MNGMGWEIVVGAAVGLGIWYLAQWGWRRQRARRPPTRAPRYGVVPMPQDTRTRTQARERARRVRQLERGQIRAGHVPRNRVTKVP